MNISTDNIAYIPDEYIITINTFRRDSKPEDVPYAYIVGHITRLSDRHTYDKSVLVRLIAANGAPANTGDFISHAVTEVVASFKEYIEENEKERAKRQLSN